MNIITNYSLPSIKTTLKQAKKCLTSGCSINMTSISNHFKPYSKQIVIKNSDFMEFVDHIGNVLRLPASDVEKQVQGKTNAQMRLMSVMIDKFNGTNFGKPVAEREDSNIVLDLFKRIKSPKEEHIGFVKRSNLPMTDVYTCFNKCEDDPKKLSALEDMYLKIGTNNKRESLMKQIVDSPNTFEYVNNFEKYAPHFDACESTEGLIAKIDEQIAEKSDSFKGLYENAYIKKVEESYPQTAVFTKEALASGYSKEGAEMLSLLSHKFETTKEIMEAGDAKGYLRIYNTTTPDNFEFRKDFIQANYHNFGKRDQVGNNEINDLAVIFEYADKNPHAKKFLEGLTNGNRGLRSAAGYIELFDKIGAERLSQDVKPILNITRNDYYNPTQTVMDYYSVLQPQQNKFAGKLRNFIERKSDITPSKVSIREQLNGDSMIREIPKTSPAPTIFDIVHVPFVKPIDTPVAEAEKTVVAETKKRSFFKPFVPKAPNAKKLVIINDVDNMIKTRLGSKTYDEQKAIYANNATKMRAGMLNEIFSSIKDTRMKERANGTFSKHKSVSNEEAVDLYRRINGKNKKLVNYMLKKTDESGQRMFSVRDILETLADANRSILEGQKNSTKLNRFTSKDERAIYDSLFNDKIAEHGKLQRKRA